MGPTHSWQSILANDKQLTFFLLLILLLYSSCPIYEDC